VIQAQKDLGANQDSEVQAMANYTHARIAFDAALGRTLEAITSSWRRPSPAVCSANPSCAESAGRARTGVKQ